MLSKSLLLSFLGAFLLLQVAVPADGAASGVDYMGKLQQEVDMDIESWANNIFTRSKMLFNKVINDLSMLTGKPNDLKAYIEDFREYVEDVKTYREGTQTFDDVKPLCEALLGLLQDLQDNENNPTVTNTLIKQAFIINGMANFRSEFRRQTNGFLDVTGLKIRRHEHLFSDEERTKYKRITEWFGYLKMP